MASDRREYERQRLASRDPQDFPITSARAVYGERTTSAGEAQGHYFHQDLLVAREIYSRKPVRHVDVGSSIYGFVSHVASFRDIEVVDIRPLENTTPGISFIRADVMDPEIRSMIGTTDSLSCLHALEHFGLGRYGDPIDYDGWRRGLETLTSLLDPGGYFYLSVPTGQRQRVEFNAHRVFALPWLRNELVKQFEVERLAFVNDDGGLVDRQDPFGPEAEVSFGAEYGCSIWVLRKTR